MKALLIGSIGVVTETSDIQRQSYNYALKEAGLDWNWDLDTYKELLGFSGGMARLELLAAATNQAVSNETITQIHRRKTEIACKQIVEDSLQPRPGLIELIKKAQERQLDVYWVTSTGSENTSAILEAADDLSSNDFKQIYLRSDVAEGKGKPAADIYEKVMSDHGLKPSECIALEDSLPSALAAKRAGLRTFVYQGELHEECVTGVVDGICKSGGDLLEILN